jgi:Imelysin
MRRVSGSRPFVPIPSWLGAILGGWTVSLRVAITRAGCASSMPGLRMRRRVLTISSGCAGPGGLACARSGGGRATGDAFNVVSRLSDIHDILGGLRVIYAGIRPAIARVDAQQAAQTKRELDALWSYVGRLRAPESGGRRFTPEQADVLGREAQQRATAIAGQVTSSGGEVGCARAPSLT